MVFTTIEYIAFFAVFFFGYYALPFRFRWMFLLAGSWFFYAYASPICLCFLAVAVLSSYVFACLIDRNLSAQRAWIRSRGKLLDREEKRSFKASKERTRRFYVAGAALVLIGMLGIFKYSNFVLSSCLIPLEFNLILPIGLSFYVFQSLGYVIDVERELIVCERNVFKHALFVSYFPQILQGPIGSYERLAPQFFVEHQFDYEVVIAGIQRVAWGFFKKVMIANIIADRINPIWNEIGDYPGFICWSVILFLYAIQLYADFSGYMDIACGCSKMLGIELDENFKCPYFSKTISAFWRNWHITLGVWFKSYVFYPILRSDCLQNVRRKLKGFDFLVNVVPTTFALFVVWFLIGLWHGADWSYVLYGLFHGIFVMLAAILGPIYDKVHNRFPSFFKSKAYAVFQIARTFSIVCVGYAIFKPGDLGKTVEIFRQMFGGWGMVGGILFFSRTRWSVFAPCLAAVVMLLIVDFIHYFYPTFSIRSWFRQRHVVVRWSFYLIGIMGMVFFGLYGQGFNNFEYFRF